MFHPTRSSGRVHPQSNTRLRSLRLESLEDRRMLSVAGLDDGSNQAIEVFHAQDALFAENAGQWDTGDWLSLPEGPEGCAAQTVPVPLPPDSPLPQPAPAQQVYFGYNKGGTQIYFTEESIEFGLSKRELKDGVDPAAADEIEMGLPGADEDLYDYSSTHFSLNFDGARPTVPTGADQAETVFNYHVGPQENWVDGVATYKRVVYDDLYAGIDLHTFSRHGEMKYEFHVEPGADWSEIRLSYKGIEGLSIGEEGSLCIETELGVIVDEGLYVYQMIDGEEVEVAGAFVLMDGDTYGFEVSGEYDPGVELVIDPEVVWGSYLGGAVGQENAYNCALDTDGNVYVVGVTFSSNWGVSGGWDDSLDTKQDGYIVKLSSSGEHLWSSYLGGAHDERAWGVTTDDTGNVYVAGETSSSDWGISGGWDCSYGGDYDGFIVKLSSCGAHLWSSYLGAARNDHAWEVATDRSGSVYVTGWTHSGDWGIAGGWDSSYAGVEDGFIAKFAPSGEHLWSSYLGGAQCDNARGVATDDSGNVYVVGQTHSSHWGISGGWDCSYGGDYDGFVACFSRSGAHLWSSYLGGAEYDYAKDVAVDMAGNVYAGGPTYSANWGINGGWTSSFGGDVDGFVVKLTHNGALEWSSYFGGSEFDWVSGLTVDESGNVYVAGSTRSDDWGVSGGWDTSYCGGRDGFVAKLSSCGWHLWSSYMGGPGDDRAFSVAKDDSGSVHVAGRAGRSDEWRIDGGWDCSLEGGCDGFIVKIADSLPGDLNSDRHVNSTDLDIVQANWGRAVTRFSLLDGDPSGDGAVGSDDLDIVRANWGAGVPTATARTDFEESAVASTPPLIGPRRASDAALSSWPNPDTGRRLSGNDFASLAEAAWIREVEGLRGKGGKKDVRRVVLSETVLWKDEG